jgi:hypothetical protein
MSQPPANELPMFESGGSNAGTWVRRIAAILCAIVLSAILFFSGFLHASSTLFNSAPSTSRQFVDAVSTPATESAIADAAVVLVENDNSLTSRSEIAADAPKLESVIEATMNSAQGQDLLRADVTDLWNLLKAGHGGGINFYDLVKPYLVAMHAQSAAVSASPATYAPSYVWVISPSANTKFFGALNSWAWALTLIGLLGAFVVTRFLIRHRPIKLLALFAMVVLPGLLLVFFGFGARDASQTRFDANGTPLDLAVLKAAVGRAGTVLGDQGLILAIVGAGMMLIWGGWWLIRNRSAQAPAATTA